VEVVTDKAKLAQFVASPARERAARSERFGAIHHEMAAHSERFGAPCEGAAGSAGMDAPGDDRNINTSGAQWVEQPKA
jgi:hypothetical protein